MKINKKITRILMALIFILSTILSFPILASAATSDYMYDVLGDGSAQITRYTGAEGVVTIPSTLDGFNITSIGNKAFAICSSLTDINIPTGVTSIGNSAFIFCSSLTSISLPTGLTSIGDAAFLNCSSLTSISLPTGLTSIGNTAFLGCNNLNSIRFNSVTTTIDPGSGTIPPTTTIIGYNGSTAQAYAINNSRTFQDINQNQTAPKGLFGVMPTTVANNDGKITGVNNLMEYKLQGANSYTLVPTGQTRITGLAAGTYQVRYAAKLRFYAGTDAVVVVATYVVSTPACLVTYRGAQNRPNSDASLYDIRFLATIDTLELDSVGFVFSKSVTMPTKDNSTVKSTTKVYESITASGLTIMADSLGGKYIIVCTVTGLPLAEIDTPIYVRAFSTKGSETTYTSVNTVTSR